MEENKDIANNIENTKHLNVNSNIKKIEKRHCPYCNNEIDITVGVHNWKNLFKKPTFNDWMTLIMLILVVVSAYAYNHDMKICKEFIANQTSNYLSLYGQGNGNELNKINLSGWNLTEDNSTNSLPNEQINIEQ